MITVNANWTGLSSNATAGHPRARRSGCERGHPVAGVPAATSGAFRASRSPSPPPRSRSSGRGSSTRTSTPSPSPAARSAPRSPRRGCTRPPPFRRRKRYHPTARLPLGDRVGRAQRCGDPHRRPAELVGLRRQRQRGPHPRARRPRRERRHPVRVHRGPSSDHREYPDAGVHDHARPGDAAQGWAVLLQRPLHHLPGR